MQPHTNHFLSWLDIWASSHSACHLGFSPLHVDACGGVVGSRNPRHSNAVLKMLTEGGCDINARDDDGKTPLLLIQRCALKCQTYDSIDVMEIAPLLFFGSCIDPSTTNQNGNTASTAIHLFSENEYHRAIGLIIIAGADISPPRHLDDESTLLAAIGGKNHLLWIALSDYGAKSNFQDSNGDTALHILLALSAPKLEQV